MIVTVNILYCLVLSFIFSLIMLGYYRYIEDFREIASLEVGDWVYVRHEGVKLKVQVKLNRPDRKMLYCKYNGYFIDVKYKDVIL